MSWIDDASPQEYAMYEEIEKLKAELAALHAADRQRTLLVDALQAELAALRPWAEVGKRAVLMGWTAELLPVEHREKCRICGVVDDHAPDCPIPALLAKLEAEKG